MGKIKQLNLRKKQALFLAAIVLILLALASGVYGYMYAQTPEHIRRPAFEHYHFRAQIIASGQAVNFSDAKFQAEGESGTCSIELSGHPVDFHDNTDQMTHVHWDGLTGGEFLKYYGWNLIGGGDDSLGLRYDKGLASPKQVAISGDVLPEVPENTNFYVYTGDKDDYQKRNWEDFLNQDLEKFFGQESSVNPSGQSSFDPTGWWLPKAAAHGDEDDGHKGKDGNKSEEELKRINNLIGNVVIFAQQTPPTDEQVKERFNNLVPLESSTCGG